MAKNSRTPQIRFKGFTDAWEQRKFAEVYSLASEGGTPDTNTDAYYRNGTIPFVRIEDTENKYINSVKTFITEEGLRHSSAWLVPSNSVIFTNGATVGNVAINRIPVATKQGILGIIPNKAVTTEYLYYLLSAGFFQREVRNRQATGTFATIILKNLNEIDVCIPDKWEQRKISDYLSSIDNLITHHQRKYEKLVNIKKALLEKMFPQGDEKVPRIRFKGFTEAWEQRKLTEFVEFFSGLTYTPNDVQENGVLVLRSSNVSNGEIVEADNVYVNPQAVNSENVKVGDIIVVVRNGSRSLIGKHAQIKAFMPNTVIGAFMTGIRSECPEFTNALLNTSRFEKEIALNMGATINQITGYMFSKMEFKIPCLDEQKVIGRYFEKLDNLIYLYRRQVEKLKNIKSALLANMFI